MSFCPECNSRIYQYQDGNWLEWICWRCGHYESNMLAFKSTPYLFKNIVRDNAFQFMKKYGKSSPPESQQRNKTPDKPTEPKILILSVIVLGYLISISV